MAEGFSLYDNCVMMQLSDEVFTNCETFSCGNAGLDDFFINDAKRYAHELMGKTYCWITDSNLIRLLLCLPWQMIASRQLIWSPQLKIELIARLKIRKEVAAILQH